MGVTIIGVGFDPPGRNASWAAEEGFQFELWTDDDRTLAVAFGAATETSPVPARLTVLLDADGNQLLEYPVTDIGTHPGKVLDDCTVLFGD